MIHYKSKQEIECMRKKVISYIKQDKNGRSYTDIIRYICSLYGYDYDLMDYRNPRNPRVYRNIWSTRLNKNRNSVGLLRELFKKDIVTGKWKFVR